MDKVDEVIRKLATQFQLKNLGPLHYFLGVQVTRNRAGLHLSQPKYINELVAKANLTQANPVATPLYKLADDDSAPFEDPHLYRQILGGLQYLHMTRPDIAYATNKLAQAMHSPTNTHWTQLKRVLRYLKGTSMHGIHIKPCTSHSLSIYTDADWAGDSIDRRSTSAYVAYLGSNIVSW
ncbi:Uncharacterized mitochondrial protein AtMg00810 [Linum perenne]